jgi:hypothetical protein
VMGVTIISSARIDNGYRMLIHSSVLIP